MTTPAQEAVWSPPRGHATAPQGAELWPASTPSAIILASALGTCSPHTPAQLVAACRALAGSLSTFYLSKDDLLPSLSGRGCFLHSPPQSHFLSGFDFFWVSFPHHLLTPSSLLRRSKAFDREEIKGGHRLLISFCSSTLQIPNDILRKNHKHQTNKGKTTSNFWSTCETEWPGALEYSSRSSNAFHLFLQKGQTSALELQGDPRSHRYACAGPPRAVVRFWPPLRLLRRVETSSCLLRGAGVTPWGVTGVGPLLLLLSLGLGHWASTESILFLSTSGVTYVHV